MGTSSSWVEVARKAERYQATVQASSSRATKNAASKVEDVFYREALSAIGGPTLVGRKWSTYSTQDRSSTPTEPAYVVGYRGPVHWIDRGTDPHFIPSKQFGGSRRGRVGRAESHRLGFVPGAGLNTPAGPRAVVFVRGVTRRPFFARAVDKAGPVAEHEVRDSLIELPLRAAGF